MLLVGVGVDIPAARMDVPLTAVAKSRSLRMVFARRTAPSMFSCPAPCCSMLAPTIGCAEYCISIFAMLGVNLGLTSNKSAAAPAATGADIEVPLMYIWAFSTVPIGSTIVSDELPDEIEL